MHPDELVRRLAERQLNLISVQQALEAGLSRDQLRHRARTGAFRRIYRGVYLVTGDLPSFEQRALAACMACGEAYVSHEAAAAIWGFAREPSAIDIVVSARRNPRVRGVRVHRRRLHRMDITERGAIPLTAPGRTLLDLAGSVDRDELESTADEAFRRSVITPQRLRVYLDRPDLANRRGIGALRALADDRCRRGVPESRLEADAIPLLRSFRLPEPTRQYEVRASGRVVRFDLAYPDASVAIELDGRAPHWGRTAWQSDHDRHNATELAGWVVLRFTWFDVHERPLHVALTVAQALDLRPRSWARTRRKVINARAL